MKKLKMMSTANLKKSPVKTLLYAHHGFGKTWQCRNFQERYGKGFVISGEAGLKSIGDIDIDYLPFISWNGPVDEDNNVYSFRSIVKLMQTAEFKAMGYKWICIDSLTELGERLMEFLEKEHEGNKNTFALWADYGRLMTGSLKWVRDLPYHVYITCLAKEEKDANDVTQYWPMVAGQAVGKKIPALFDHVLCGVRSTDVDDTGKPKVKRYIVTDEVHGWHGKTRDPRHRLDPFEECYDITELFVRMEMDDDEYSAMTKTKKEK